MTDLSLPRCQHCQQELGFGERANHVCAEEPEPPRLGFQGRSHPTSERLRDIWDKLQQAQQNMHWHNVGQYRRPSDRG